LSNASGSRSGQHTDTQSQAFFICEAVVDSGSYEAPPSLHVLEEQGSGAETGRGGTASAGETSASSSQGVSRRNTQATKAALG
jgi:hypothetical protein